MRSLYIKEISQFFSSLTGYVVVILFLLVNGFFLWVRSGGYNILDAGYASLDPLFNLAPILFLILIPPITMRSFSEEKKSGNLDLLITRPLSEMQIVIAKYAAAFTVAIIAIIPTLIFFLSIVLLQNPELPSDTGAIWGSYLGLLFLSAIYASIGIFSSSITDNTVIALLLAILISAVFLFGFYWLGSISNSGSIGNIIENLGIYPHYKSIRRGVIDSRDIIYFSSVVVLFLYLTKTILKSRNW